MADHREECSNDVTLENLEVVRIFADKVAKELPLR